MKTLDEDGCIAERTRLNCGAKEAYQIISPLLLKTPTLVIDDAIKEREIRMAKMSRPR
jgi:hypothetical protein